MALGRSADLSVEISGDAAGLERALKSAESATHRATNAVARYDSALGSLESDLMRLEKQIDDDMAAALGRQHDAMDKAGRGLVLFGAAASAALGLAGREAMRWETAWTGVTKTVDGSEQEMAALEAQLRGLAKVLPASHEEIAAVAEAAGQLGVERGSVAAFTRTMIDLGETTNLSASDAATQLARLQNIMGTSTDDVDKLGSTLVGLGNNFATTEAEILELSLRLAAAGRQAGLSEADILGFAATLTSVGVPAEAAGTAMSKVFTKIGDSVRDGGAELEVFAQVAGMSTAEFARAFEEDAAGAIDTWIQGMGRVAETGGSTTRVFEALELTDQRLMRAILSTAGAGDVLSRSLALGNGAFAENLALAEEASKRYETAEARIAMAGNTLRDSAIDIGAVVLPVLANVAEFVGDLATAFGGLPGPVKSSIAVVGALAAAVALAGGAALIAVPKIAAFKTAVAGLEAGALKTAGTRLAGLAGVLTGPWGLAIAGGVTALGIFAAKHGEAVAKVDALRQTLDEQTGALTDNSREWLKKQLVDSGAVETAKDLGLDLELVARAAMDQKGAVAELNDELNRLKTAGTQANEAGVTFTDQYYAAKRLQGILGDMNGTLADAREEMDLEREVGEALADTTERVADKQEDTNTAWRDGEDAAGGMAEEVKTLGEELRELSGAYLDQRAAQRAVRDQLRDIRKATREYAKEHDGLKGTFKQGTRSGDEFAGMLDDLARSYQDKIDATEKAGAGEKRVQQVYESSRRKLIEVARELGMTREEARAYARQVLDTPKQVKTRFDAETERAQASVDSLVADLRGLEGRTWRTQVTVAYSRSGYQAPGIQRADGGLVTGPGGPRDDAILARLSNGEYVVNAESTARHRPLLEAINAKRFADGGFVGGSAAPISIGFLMGQQRQVEQAPNLRGYRRALRAEAEAVREVRRERRQLREARKAEREAAREADRVDSPEARKRAREAAREAEKAERDLAKAKDRHARATGRVKDAVNAYADAQAAQVAKAQGVAQQAASAGSLFGSGGFSDAGSVSQRITETINRVRRFIRVRRQLVAAGVHPSLLDQLDDEGPTEGAIQLGEELLADPDQLGRLNRQSARLETVSQRLGADTAAVNGPRAGREVRYGAGAGQTLVVHQTVHAPQNMSPRQVGDAAMQRLVARLRK